MKKISKKTIAAINNLSPTEFENRGIQQAQVKGVICPHCGNGSGSDGTGVDPYITDSHVGWHCFKCGSSFNNLRILAKHYGLDLKEDFDALVGKICADFGIPMEYTDFDAPTCKSKRAKRQHEEKPLDECTLKFIKDDLAAPVKPLQQMLEGVNTWRGLPLDTLLKFNCRLIWQWTPPSSRIKPYTPTARMIIPCSNEAYLSRAILPPEKEFGSDQDKREFFKGKEKMHAGHKSLFNPDALKAAQFVFVVEGYPDAMSIDLAGYPCVALGAAARGDLLVDAVAKMKNKPYVVILLDGDDTGRQNAPKLCQELIGEMCPAVVRYFTEEDSKLDANEILMTQGLENLRGRLAQILEDSVAELAALAADFKAKIETRLSDEKLNSLFKGKDSDLVFAQRLETFCGASVRWLTDSEQWLLWKAGLWQRGSEKNSSVAHLGTALAETMTTYAQKQSERELAEKFQSAKKISAAITLLKTRSSIRITAEDLDKHPNLLNCQNCVVDLETGEFYPHDTKYLLSQQCRADYHAGDRSPLVEKFFRDIMPDEMTREGLLRWLGYCLTGSVAEEKFAVWTGSSGANGKSTLTTTLIELLGSYACSLPTRALLRRRTDTDADRATTALNALENARFAISDELPLDSELDSALVKNLSGGDRIPLRRNYGEYHIIKPTAKLNASGNYPPKIENVHDGGILRRMIDFPFIIQFGMPERPADPLLKKKLLQPENLRGLLALLVREAVAWYRGGGLIISPMMKQATQQHLSQNDFIADFIADNYLMLPNASVKAKDFIDALLREYPKECSRFKRNDLIQLVAKVDGVTYDFNRAKIRIFKGLGKPKGDWGGEPVDKDDVPFD